MWRGASLSSIHQARTLRDLSLLPGNRLEALKHDRLGQHSVRINDQYRVCFVWEKGDARDVEIVDYHQVLALTGRLTMAKRELPPVHPGEVLREDYLIPAGVTVNALAMALRVPVSRMYEIVNRERAITPETALRLSRYLGTSAEFWLGLQSDYDLET